MELTVYNVRSIRVTGGGEIGDSFITLTVVDQDIYDASAHEIELTFHAEYRAARLLRYAAAIRAVNAEFDGEAEAAE